MELDKTQVALQIARGGFESYESVVDGERTEVNPRQLQYLRARELGPQPLQRSHCRFGGGGRSSRQYARHPSGLASRPIFSTNQCRQ